MCGFMTDPWQKSQRNVIGEEARQCSGTAGFHLVRGPEENCLRHQYGSHELTHSQWHRGVYQGETFVLEFYLDQSRKVTNSCLLWPPWLVRGGGGV
jgi:hypothetical protein